MPDPRFERHPERLNEPVYVWHLDAQFDRRGREDFPKTGIVRRVSPSGARAWHATGDGGPDWQPAAPGYGKTKADAVFALTGVNRT